MAYKLFQRLNRAVRAGAPEFFGPQDRGISPQLQSNLNRQAESVRFREFRRTQGRPGITGPFGFVAGRTAPIPPQIAAGRISSRLGTDFGTELTRLTAPDPKAFAEGLRAPEFAETKLAKRAAGTRLTAAEAEGLEEKLPFISQREEAEIGQLTGEEERAALAAEGLREQRDVETEAARLGISVDELEIERLKSEAAGRPSPDVVRTREEQDRAAEVARGQREVRTADEQRVLDRIDSEIETARQLGDFDRVQQLEQEARDIATGFVGPRAPAGTVGGAPPVSRGARVSPVMLQMRGGTATAIAEATGLEGAIAMLADVTENMGTFPDPREEQKLQTAAETIRRTMDMARDETVRDMLRSKIRNSEGYIGIKQRASETFMQQIGFAAGKPLSTIPALLTGRGNRKDRMREVAQQIVELVDGSLDVGGAPPVGI